MTTDYARVTLEWLKQNLRDDQNFPREALSVLARVDPQSTHTMGSSAESLVDWWLTERELKCYERGEVVKDTTNVILYADHTGSFDAAERSIELAWKVDLAEFMLLLKSQGMSVPEFLVPKTASPDQSMSVARVNWIEASLEVANEVGAEMWRCGMQEITARGVANKVAERIAKTRDYWGKRGPRDGQTIRKVALKGWQFMPPIAGDVGDVGANEVKDSAR